MRTCKSLGFRVYLNSDTTTTPATMVMAPTMVRGVIFSLPLRRIEVKRSAIRGLDPLFIGAMVVTFPRARPVK